MNCPNCGAVLDLSKNVCEYCETPIRIPIDDISRKPISGGYTCISYHDELNNYRTADGRFHRSVSNPKRVITIVED